MIQLGDYYSVNDSILTFTRKQGSDFAKHVAGDFNPIHDPDNKRFCVPGDLLFTVFLAERGIHQNMCFTFAGMVNDTSKLILPNNQDEKIDIQDEKEKTYMTIDRSGDYSDDINVIKNIACNYVEFSGHTFPHILVPLMSEKNVMINPARPLVMYEKMAINLDRLDVPDAQLEVTETELEVNGKRGKAILKFCFKAGDEVIGHGKKSMLLSGLREYDQEQMQHIIDDYDARKSSFLSVA